MKAPISTAIAIGVGLLILLGYFIPVGPLYTLRVILLDWAVILAAFALLVGVVNLLRTHVSKITIRQKGWGYSILLIVTLLLTLFVVGYFGPANPVSLWIFSNIQLPIEASLVALLAVVLVVAAIRLFARRPNGYTLLFVGVALIALIGITPLIGFGEIGVFQQLRDLLVKYPAVAGARGILLGVALGTIATGFRILMGADRPYGG